jgi:hypothetical protein
VSEVPKDSDGTSVSDEPHYQTVAVQRLGDGHDWKNQSSIQQRPPIYFSHHGLLYQVGRGGSP